MRAVRHDLFRRSGGWRRDRLRLLRGDSRGSARIRPQVRSAALPPVRRGSREDPLRTDRGERLAYGRDDHGRYRPARRRDRQAGLGSPGIDELRWKKPVYPGDTLHVRGQILEKTPSRSRPEMGSFRTRTTVTNQNGETVMTFISIVLIRRRPACSPKRELRSSRWSPLPRAAVADWTFVERSAEAAPVRGLGGARAPMRATASTPLAIVPARAAGDSCRRRSCQCPDNNNCRTSRNRASRSRSRKPYRAGIIVAAVAAIGAAVAVAAAVTHAVAEVAVSAAAERERAGRDQADIGNTHVTPAENRGVQHKRTSRAPRVPTACPLARRRTAVAIRPCYI